MEFYCTSDYLELPVSYHAQKKRLFFYTDGELVYDLVAAIDPYEPDEKYFIDMKRFRGKRMCVRTEPEIEFPVKQTDTREDGKAPYCGKYRPLAHYTAKRGWLNDPNGLVYYRGKYLMFYQHNPVGWFWENMHWGCAISRDLVHWEEREIVLYPDGEGTMFSGCAVVDRDNVTGLKCNDNDVILLFYTTAGSTSETAREKPFTQCLAYSVDKGETFVKYGKNPLLGQIAPGNRDPKVIYHEESGQYVMALYLDKNEYALFVSENLIAWRELQRITIPEEIECPDFFPLAADTAGNRKKWILIGASDRYLIGDFDGKKFVPDSDKPARLNYGNTSYAAQSWSNMPDGRRVRISCCSGESLDMPFGGCMSMPAELFLRTEQNSVKLCAYPAKEIEKLYAAVSEMENVRIEEEKPLEICLEGQCYDVAFRVRPQKRSVFQWSFFGLVIRFDEADGTLAILDREVSVSLREGALDVRIILDRICGEVYVNGGSIFMGISYIQDISLNKMRMTTENAPVVIEKIKAARLSAFWEKTEG